MAKNTCVKCDGPINISEPNSKGLRNWKCADKECGAGGYYDHKNKKAKANAPKETRPPSEGVPVPQLQPTPQEPAPGEPAAGAAGNKPGGTDPDGDGAGAGNPPRVPWYERGPSF